jgi:hypothetical protein
MDFIIVDYWSIRVDIVNSVKRPRFVGFDLMARKHVSFVPMSFNFQEEVFITQDNKYKLGKISPKYAKVFPNARETLMKSIYHGK